jgi:hypothetical protein
VLDYYLLLNFTIMLVSSLEKIISNEDPRFEYIQVYSDYHKDAFGYRPRYNYSDFTLEQLVADFERFGKVFDENQREAELRQKRNIDAFESRIASTIQLGANDRQTALKWICDGDEVDAWDISYYLWKQGISSYDGDGNKLEVEILEVMRANLE